MLVLACGLLLRTVPGWSIPPATIGGVVKDRSGAVVPNATVELRLGSQTVTRTTGEDGSFLLKVDEGSTGELTVTAPGFRKVSARWSVGDSLTIILQPAPVQQSLEVTATRSPILPTGTEDLEIQPGAATIPAVTLEQWGAVTTDDKLRQYPGFSLLRRSGSMTANPTSQGLSLRGLGASGASRALVLEDGIPLNDPFGGWLFWGRVPQAALSEAQIVPGGVSALYGNDALGGVVNLETRSAAQTSFAADGSFGNNKTPLGSGFGAVRFGEWALAGSAEGFRTNGYIPVPKNLRGAVDSPVASEHRTGDLRLERFFGDRGRTFLEGSIYGESRRNGTPLQRNQAAIRQLALGADYETQNAGLFTLRLFGRTESYHQTFSSTAADRNSESLTNDQHVPVQQIGGIGQWSKLVTTRLSMLAGVDAQDVEGTSEETTYTLSRFTARLWNGGRQQSLGAFVGATLQVTQRWSLTASGREDLWSNFDASSTRIPRIGAKTQTFYPRRGQNSFDPRVTTSYRVGEHVVLYGAGYRSFRAPTLNELYRSFRVGNVQTFANPYLRAEHFAGGEGGTRIKLAGDRVSVDGSFFWGYVSDPVANVTLSTTSQLITRQRQNLGRLRSRGVQVGTSVKVTQTFALSGAYQFLDSTVIEFPASRALVGKMVPLVPRHNFTFQGTWSAPGRFLVGLQGRTASNEFDDDQNLLPLGSYFVLSASISHALPKRFEIYVAGDNLTNSSYEIARTPVVNLGQPVLVRVGLRWQSHQ